MNDYKLPLKAGKAQNLPIIGNSYYILKSIDDVTMHFDNGIIKVRGAGFGETFNKTFRGVEILSSTDQPDFTIVLGFGSQDHPAKVNQGDMILKTTSTMVNGFLDVGKNLTVSMPNWYMAPGKFSNPLDVFIANQKISTVPFSNGTLQQRDFIHDTAVPSPTAPALMTGFFQGTGGGFVFPRCIDIAVHSGPNVINYDLDFYTGYDAGYGIVWELQKNFNFAVDGTDVIKRIAPDITGEYYKWILNQLQGADGTGPGSLSTIICFRV